MPDHSRIELLAKAFEIQLREGFFLPFCSFVKSIGILDYPARPGMPALLRRGNANDRLMLGELASAFDCGLPEIANFAAAHEVNLPALIEAIRQVAAKSGMAKHRLGLPQEAARQIKDEWLGGYGRQNIFAHITSRSEGTVGG